MGYAITTRYHGPTNYRGSRVIATGPAPSLPAWDAPHGSVPLTRATVGWDYGAGNAARDGEPAAYDGRYAGWGDSDANHRRAADAVVAKLRAAGWTVDLAPDDRGATLPDERGRVFVLRYGVDR
jgi:hypothetical protein